MNTTKLDFNEDFFNEEKLCDYTVSRKQKKIWAIELDLLNEFMNVCNKYEIKFLCFAGTLLGAVRHHGFIPWDDDIDVCLTRTNYEKLLNVANKEFSDPYFFQTAQTDRRFFCPYARLRNSNTTGVIAWNFSNEYNNGIYIDIFVMDGIIENPNLVEMQMLKKKKLEWALNYHPYLIKNIGIDGKIQLIKQYLKKIYGKLYGGAKDYDGLCKAYFDNLQRYNSKANKVGLLTHGIEMARKYCMYKDEMDDIVYAKFENLQVPIPKNYDVVLTRIYGKYMDFPPEDKRGKWHNDAIYFDPDISYIDYLNR